MADPQPVPSSDVVPEESPEPTQSEGPTPAPGPSSDAPQNEDSGVARQPDSRTSGPENDPVAREVEPRAGTTDIRPRCEAGFVYGISGTGQIRQVAPNGTVTNLGQPAAGVSSFNGIGIGANGSHVYAYERSNTNRTVTIWRYDTAVGTWSSTGLTVNSQDNNRTVVFVAGAVNLDSGRYYFGGFSSTGAVFQLWEYDPASNAVTYKGYLNTNDPQTSTNGDLAFDAVGNMFVVRGSGNTTTVLSVTAENLATANGGLITSSRSPNVTTTNNINGVAFDSSGKAYLGSPTQLRSYDMPDWTNSTTVVSSNLNSTDLATCTSPPTITIEKYIEGARVESGDQFKLTLHRGDTLIDDTITEGNATGTQNRRIGPMPTVPNRKLTFAETAAGTTNLDHYASSYQCFIDGELVAPSSGEGTSGTITIPTGADAVLCRFHNSRLIANVTIHKEVRDVNGANPQPGVGWTVGAQASATTGTATQAPAATTQQTTAQGDAAWQVRFGGKSSRATVTVSETQQDGFEFVSGKCTITNLAGASREVTLTSEAGRALPGVAPGDTVDCTYVNKPKAATVEVDKLWVVNGEQYTHGNQPDGLTATLTLNPPGTSPDATVDWDEARGPFTIGQRVTIGETTAIDPELLPGCTLDSAVLTGPGNVSASVLTAGHEVTLPGQTNEYVITNTVSCQQLTLIKKVENTFGGDKSAADWDGALFANQGDTSVSFDSGQTRYVASGDWVLSETELDGYELASLTCGDATFDAETKMVTVPKGGEVTCTFVNTDKPGAVEWAKVDSGDTDTFLPGSQWQITGPGLNAATIEDCVAGEANECTGLDKNPEGGKFLLQELSWGDYTVTETKAPPGYVLSSPAKSFTFTVNATNAGTTQTAEGSPFTNLRPDGPDLPHTGGIGRDQILLAGALTLLLAVAGYGTRRVRSRGNRSAA